MKRKRGIAFLNLLIVMALVLSSRLVFAGGLPAELVDVGASATFIPEVGQSVATAHQQAIHRVAEQIVGLMENPW